MTEQHLLWNDKKSTIDPKVMAFMAGNDILLDQHLFLYDIQGTASHIQGLTEIGLLTEQENQSFQSALTQLKDQFESGDFVLDQRFEDGHSAIEWFLVEQLGDLGKKAHTGRSRNDQVLTCLRLYMKDQLQLAQKATQPIVETLLSMAEAHIDTLMPGYTHLQRAMPNTACVWLAGHAESLIDGMYGLANTRELLNASPLGAAAGFGVPLPLAREKTAQLMGFDRVQINPFYVQNSRGKFELMTLQSLYHVMLDIRRLSWDLSLFMTAEFNFITMNSSHTTGSSIMPNKNNPDVVELMRAQLAVIEGAMQEIQAMLSLPSGYQRDLQMSKAPLIRAVQCTLQTLELVPGLLNALQFNEKAMSEAISEDMMATDQAIEAAKEGVSFRDAYLDAKSGQGFEISAQESIKNRVSLGGAANPGLNLIRSRLEGVKL